MALTKHRKSIIFRRQEQDASSLVERAGEIVGDFGRWSGKDRTYRTNDRRSVTFGHCSRPGAENSHQGKAHDMKGFDELAHFTEYLYLFLSGWLRSTDPNIRCQIVSGSNPPTSAEGMWIIKRWAPWLDKKHPDYPAPHGQIRWFARIDDDDVEMPGPEPFEHPDGKLDDDGNVEIIAPRSRTFIGAKLGDNPYYAKSGYKAVLQSLKEPLRSILLEGKFDAAMQDDPWQVIPTAWVEAAMDRWTDKVPGPMSAAGVDVARCGEANTTIARRHGDWFNRMLKYPGIETPTGPAAAGKVTAALRDGAPAQVDIIGVGASCFDHLTEMEIPCAAMDARKSTDKTDRSGTTRFFNMRSYWWWAMREALDPDTGDNIALPPDQLLLADLVAPTYSVVPRGVKVEAKEDIEKRLSRSVDDGDAVVMGLQQEIPPGGKKRRVTRQKTRTQSHLYNPHKRRVMAR